MSYYNQNNFTPHTMWHPTNGSSVYVTTYTAHTQYMALGYTHSPSYSSYSVDYPTNIAPESYDIASISQTQISVTQSLNRIVSDKGGQRWQISFNYPPLTRDKFSEIWSFLVKQKGRFGRFSMALPNMQARGSLAVQTNTTIKVKSDVARGNTVTLKNFVASSTGVIKKGDYFRFSSSSKVYLACEDYDSDANGEVIITTYPNIVHSVSTDDDVYFEPVFTVSLSSDTINANVPLTNNANFSVEFIEVISNTGVQALY
tara:strand:+ start:650 stop:1423 length:774 start_codon:yes stop_codon:yes gene_type:complete